MQFGKMGARGGFGSLGVLGGAGKPVPGVLRAAISGVINLATNVRQTNLIGGVISGVVNLAANISLSAGVQIGAVISASAILASGLVQTNRAGAVMSGSIALAGDIATTKAIPFASDLVAHFDAASPALSNGAAVSSWTDSVSNIVAAQATSGNKATYATNRLNGLPSIQFPGTWPVCKFLSIASPGAMASAIDSLDYTVFIVFRTLGGSVSTNQFGTLFAATPPGGNSFWYQADGTNAGCFNNGASLQSVPFAGQTSFSTLGSTAFNTTPSYSSSGTFQSFYINGGAFTSTTEPAVGSGGNTFTIGCDTGSNYPVNAEIFDIIVWDRPLTPAEFMQVHMWACDKYAQPYPWASLATLPVFFGDSITQGVLASDVTKQAPYLAVQSLGLSFGQWHNIGVGGISLNHLGTLAPTWVDPIPALIGQATALVSFEWYNQQDSTSTAGATYLAARKAVTNLKTVWGTSTSASAIDPSTARASYNSAWDAIWAGAKTNIDSYMALHLDTHIGIDGSYATYSAPTGGDGVHLTDTTYPYLAALFVAGINAL